MQEIKQLLNNIKGKYQVRPTDNKAGLKSPTFKTTLIKFLMQEWKDEKYKETIKDKTIIASHKSE